MCAAIRWHVAVLAVALLMLGGCGAAPINYNVVQRYTTADPQFVYSMGNAFGQSFVGENQVTTLVDGEAIFPAMLEAIESAQKTITFETYIWMEGQVASRFVEALTERAAAGVRVHMIIDAVGGTAANWEQLKRLSDAGADIRQYHPLRWWQIGSATKLNYRTHRKLLIIDGRIGFIGGVGISDWWLHGEGDDDGEEDDEIEEDEKDEEGGPWRDNHYRVEGPVVGKLQGAFVENWIEMTGEILHGEEYFPKIEPAGDMVAQVINSSTASVDQSVQVMYLMSLAAARERICLATPYFVPDEPTRREILNARVRGVKVQVIVPHPDETDSMLTHQASRAGWGELLKAGVEIYEYEPTMYHVKMMVIDDLWVSIGSANLDNRSFKLNDETNLNVLDSEFAAEQMRLFEADLARARRVQLDGWKARPWWQKVLDGTSTLMESQL